jgi:hypothetical protein
MRAVDGLDQLSHDGGAGGVGELRQLAQVLVGGAPRAGSLARRADQDRPFDGRLN